MQLFGLREHAGHGFAARFGQELGIALEFAADEVLERGRDVAPDMLGPHGVALYEPFQLDDLHAGNRFGVDDNHDILPALYLLLSITWKWGNAK